MYILTNDKREPDGAALLEYVSPNIRSMLTGLDFTALEEIRLRLGLPLSICMQSGTFFVGKGGKCSKLPNTAYTVTQSDIASGLELISQGSLYSLENEIRQGYITLAGGHRVGIAGKVVRNGTEITYLKDISGLNYRFAKQIIGAADAVIHDICYGALPQNTLLLSPPQCGKTTMLRDLARQLSYMGYKVCVVDERCEIGGMSQGVSSYDIGPQTDVLDACPKAEGMMMALRSLSPQVLITDEIGTKADMEAIHTALSCGVSVIASVHASNREDLKNKPNIEQISQLFACIVTLSKRKGSGTVEEVYVRP